MSKGTPLPSCRQCGSDITGGSNEGVYGVGLCEFCEEAAIHAHAKRLLEPRNTPPAAHCPGPWHIGNRVDQDDLCVYSLCKSEAADGHAIAYLDNNHDEGTNATLIAAAPDLLAACKWALELHCPDGDDDECGAIAALKEAIAKAEGRT